jgi:hypothetical protein
MQDSNPIRQQPQPENAAGPVPEAAQATDTATTEPEPDHPRPDDYAPVIHPRDHLDMDDQQAYLCAAHPSVRPAPEDYTRPAVAWIVRGNEDRTWGTAFLADITKRLGMAVICRADGGLQVAVPLLDCALYSEADLLPSPELLAALDRSFRDLLADSASITHPEVLTVPTALMTTGGCHGMALRRTPQISLG